VDLSPSIELRIGELVLEGFSGINRAELSMALQTELSKLLAGHGLPNASDGRSIDRLDAGAFHLKSSANARPMAAELAQRIYKGLTQ
jgi:hypothetical protein